MGIEKLSDSLYIHIKSIANDIYKLHNAILHTHLPSNLAHTQLNTYLTK